MFTMLKVSVIDTCTTNSTFNTYPTCGCNDNVYGFIPIGTTKSVVDGTCTKYISCNVNTGKTIINTTCLPLSKCKTQSIFPPGVISNCNPNQVVNYHQSCNFTCNPKLVNKPGTIKIIVECSSSSTFTTYPTCGCNGGSIYGFIPAGCIHAVTNCKYIICDAITGKVSFFTKC